jgi:Lrp/AsnC family leucine-responsive transcriptional regulator
VSERIRRLEAVGLIAGYRVVLSPSMFGLPLMAYIRIRPKTGHWASIADLAQRTVAVVECHRISGQDGFLLKVQVAGFTELEAVLDRFVDLGETSTAIVQSSPVPPRGVPLPAEA